MSSPPSTWGATYWKDWQRCERYHYLQFARGLELPAQAPQDEAALACGIEFHDWMERRLGAQPIDHPVGPGGPWPPAWKEDPIGAARWLFDEYAAYYGPIVRGALSANGATVEVVQEVSPTADSTESRSVRNLEILGVEVTLTIEPPALGLLLPVSAKFDTIVRMNNRADHPAAALEHKTADKGYSFQRYQMDTQVGLQCLTWNYHHPEDKLAGVIIDEVNKSKNPKYRFRRELLTRTGPELYYLTQRLIRWQELKLEQDFKAVELSAAGKDPQEAYPQRTTQCFQFGKPCKYLPICKFGARAEIMYEQRSELVPQVEEEE